MLKDRNMLISIQSTLRVRDTLVPRILMSNVTALSNLAGNKKEWQVYSTISTLSSKIRQMPPTHSLVNVVLLLIPMMNRNTPQNRQNEQQQTN
jgi:hypothetical protein